MTNNNPDNARYRSDFSVRRYFSVSSLVGILIAAIVFVYFYRTAMMQDLVDAGEQEHIAITRALVNNLWPDFAPFIDQASVLSTDELAKHEITRQTYLKAQNNVLGLPILKIKFFDLNAKTVFSTDQAEIGERKPPDYPGSVSAKTGKIITKITQRDTFSAIQGELTDRRIASSYLPLVDSHDNTVRGVFEVYYDVTEGYAKMEHSLLLAFFGISITLSILYLILFFVSKKADDLIKRQSTDLKDYLAKIEEQNQLLEDRVKERTEELNTIVNELEKHKLHLEDLVSERTRELTKAKNDAVKANETKSIFLANMSHELRTPLNAILGYSEIMREDHMDNEQISQDLGKIYVAGNHLLSVIDDILDISKIESGKMETYFEHVNVSEIVTEVVNSIAKLTQAANNKIAVNIVSEPESFITDSTKFRQILYNLINNANKFTKDGNITVSVTHSSYGTEPWLKIVVSDTGIGMEPGQLDKIFRSFSQADSSTTRKFGGTGLGLAISKGLCELLGGIISVESSTGVGSSFIVRLPANRLVKVQQHVAEVLEIGPKVDPAQVRFGQEGEDVLKRREKITTILAIDDDAEVRDLMERFLSRKGFYAHTAASADEGIELAKKVRPDIIITDIMMPIKDGITFIKEVKTIPEIAKTPIIVLTIAGERETCMSLGVSSYLNKPVDWNVLLDFIRQACRRVYAAHQKASA